MSIDPATLPLGNLDTTLGLELVLASADRVEARLPVTEKLHQPFGIVHGGVYCAIVETCASFGGALWYYGQGHDGQVVGVANHTDFLRSVRDGELFAVGTPIHRGRSQQLWLVEIRDQDQRLIARGEVRLQNLPAR